MGDSKEFVTKALTATRLFSGLPADILNELAPFFVERTFEKDEVVFHQGDEGEALFVVISGQVSVEREIMDGRRVTLALRGPGSVLGEMALLDGTERSASIYAIERTKGLTLARSSFFRFLSGHAEAFQSLLIILCQRLRESDQKVEDLGSKTLLERLAGTLLNLASTEGTASEAGVELPAMVNYQLLTGLLCTNRESVSRAIRELRKMDLLDKVGRRFLLKDLQALSDLYQSNDSSSP
jgi:CRP/FNR family transcriptional regulator, cyclic AMP receptor protein